MGNLYCTMFTHSAGGFKAQQSDGVKEGHLSELASSTMAQAAGAARRGRGSGRGRGRQRGRGRGI